MGNKLGKIAVIYMYVSASMLMMYNYLEQGDSSYNISGVFEDTSDLRAGGVW